jgi:hypothetical protein
MRGNRNVGGYLSGGGGGETKRPKERYDLIFLSISTEPKWPLFSSSLIFSYGLRIQKNALPNEV